MINFRKNFKKSFSQITIERPISDLSRFEKPEYFPQTNFRPMLGRQNTTFDFENIEKRIENLIVRDLTKCH